MSKQLNFNFMGTDYCLEFTRRSVETMERQGFRAADITDKPMTTLPTLFAGAFIAHHPYVKRKVIDEIYSRLNNKQELIGKLAEMYNEPILALVDDPEENEGNVNWTATW